MQHREAQSGCSILATCNGSTDIFPDNNASKFTNTLKSQIRLNPNLDYEICLSNLHTPAYEALLVGDDFEGSYIKYNIGLFLMDPRASQHYTLKSDTSRELFRLAPNRDIHGLFSHNDREHRYNFKSPNNDVARDKSGLPAIRQLKDKFIDELSSSLHLDPRGDRERLLRETKILDYFRATLAKNAVYSDMLRGPKSNLLARWFSDLNILLFSEFTHLDQNQMLFFISTIMMYVKYPPHAYRSMISSVSQIPKSLKNDIPNLSTVALQGLASGDFINHIRRLEAECAGLSEKFHSYTDENLRKLHRHPETLKMVTSTVNKVCKRSHVPSINNDNSANTNDSNTTTSTTTTTATTTTAPTGTTGANSGNRNNRHDLKRFSPFIGVYVTFGKRMCKFLNVDQNQSVLIASFGFPTLDIVDYYLKISPDFRKKKVETLLIYSDLVAPEIRVGGFMTNLLDIISVPNDNTIQRTMTQPLYRPLKNHTIDSVSIVVTDTVGEEIHFEEDSYSAFELRIRGMDERNG